jgi:hypothetical protein
MNIACSYGRDIGGEKCDKDNGYPCKKKITTDKLDRVRTNQGALCTHRYEAIMLL